MPHMYPTFCAFWSEIHVSFIPSTDLGQNIMESYAMKMLYPKEGRKHLLQSINAFFFTVEKYPGYYDLFYLKLLFSDQYDFTSFTMTKYHYIVCIVRCSISSNHSLS